MILRRAKAYPVEEKRHVPAIRISAQPKATIILRLTLMVRVRPWELTTMTVKTFGRELFTIGRDAGRFLSKDDFILQSLSAIGIMVSQGTCYCKHMLYHVFLHDLA